MRLTPNWDHIRVMWSSQMCWREMQTKNVNVAPLNNTVCSPTEVPPVPVVADSSSCSTATVAPPLPPRQTHELPPRQTAEVEGGAYKPVPPPKRVVTSSSPPPYRMPPYPLYSEPSSTLNTPLPLPTIPGAASTENLPHSNLHTHSSKFPIEREVILSSADKNSKIPILNEYRKRSKTAIAPDAPNKQLAWTEDKSKCGDSTMQGGGAQDSMPAHQVYKAQPMTLLDSSQLSEPSPIRPQDLNGYSSISPSTISTGAVPKTPMHSTPEENGGSKPFPARTYHTIKDMISSRFNKRDSTTPQHQQHQHQHQQHQQQHHQTPATPSSQHQTPRHFGGGGDDSLSPQSQLRQHGVYLASSQQQNRAMTHANNSNDLMRRNQEIRLQLERERREREAADDGGFLEPGGANRMNHAGSKHSIIEMETPRRSHGVNHVTHDVINQRDVISEQRTPGAMRRVNDGNSIRPNEVYGRTPQPAYHPSEGGYGVPGNRKSLVEMENARRMAEADMIRSAPDLTSQQQQSQLDNHQTPRSNSYMQSANGNFGNYNNYQTPGTPGASRAIKSEFEETKSQGVYVSRTPMESRMRSVVDSRTPTEFRAPASDLRAPKPNLQNKPDRRSSVYVSSDRLDSVIDQGGGAVIKGAVSEGDDIHQRLKDDLDDDDVGFSKGGGGGSDYEKLRSGMQSDSGRGSTVYSSGKAKTERTVDTSPEPLPHPGGNESQWVDMVESELRHILDPKLHHNHSIANSTLSESISSVTPPLPPLSPGGSSDDTGPTFKNKGLSYGVKSEFKGRNNVGRGTWSRPTKDKTPHHRHNHSKTPGSKVTPNMMCSSLELDSMLDENNSSDELSTTVDTADTRAIRKQLEGLENMYSEVLKLLGVKKQTPSGRYQASDPRVHKRRLHGSLSSLPSSVSSRPIRYSDKRRQADDRKKVKDIKGINKRFQRLESHVVTLARSVAHLSSEMRTQHLMIQEMEVIRGELAALRSQTNMVAARSQSVPRALNKVCVEQTHSTPDKVKKLTKFFGDEPPLMRLFLKKLGYEKYASVFESEKIGLVELPYLSEERLHKLGIPLGPRMRILSEAQLGLNSSMHENTLCIV